MKEITDINRGGHYWKTSESAKISVTKLSCILMAFVTAFLCCLESLDVWGAIWRPKPKITYLDVSGNELGSVDVSSSGDTIDKGEKIEGFLCWEVLEVNALDADKKSKTGIYLYPGDLINANDIMVTYYQYVYKDYQYMYEDAKYCILYLQAVVKSEIEFTKKFAGDYGKFVGAVNSALESATSELGDEAKDEEKNAKKQEIMRNLFSQLFGVSEGQNELKETTAWLDDNDKIIADAETKYLISDWSIPEYTAGSSDSTIVFKIQVVKRSEQENKRTIKIKEKDTLSQCYKAENNAAEVEI